MFVAGKRYHRRRDIHEVVGGQRYGGMTSSSSHPLVLLFTSGSGEQHGYKDEFKEDGTFWYTGEGQVGDQQFTKSNKALRDHKQNGKTVHLFEADGEGYVSYVGEVECLGYHRELRPDRAGNSRQAIVFELAINSLNATDSTRVASSNAPSPSIRQLRRKSLAELRQLAVTGVAASSSKEVRVKNVRLRSAAVKAYVLQRAGGVCEGCCQPAPFRTTKGEPYLEPHHTTRLADGGPDHPAHVIGLCPTCHRRVHHGEDGKAYNDKLRDHLVAIEPIA